jgi:deoxyribonuclease-4
LTVPASTSKKPTKRASAVGAPAAAAAPERSAAGATNGLLLGAHVSAAGGVPEAPARAAAIGATALQLFTKMANRWAERDCAGEECAAFRERLAAAGVAATMAHDSYLINLASPDPVLRARSIASFATELRRCEALGLHYLVSHPGNYMDDREAGLARNAEAINEAFALAPGTTVLCLETTAGTGTALGATFEELSAIIALIEPAYRARVGICLDTCHAYSAGYDLVKDYDGVLAHLDDALGLDRLRVMHLNDSKTPFASRRDRHELIAEGSLGEAPFRRIMTDDRLARVPKVIETPKLDDATATDTRMLERLRGYAEG